MMFAGLHNHSPLLTMAVVFFFLFITFLLIASNILPVIVTLYNLKALVSYLFSFS